jgi:flagellar hook-basal body complex protein FliE
MNNIISSNLPSFPGTEATRPTASSNAGEGFGSTLKNAINQVNDLGDNSDQKVTELLQGDRSDIHNVMIAVEKADIAFQLMMQVRNKIVNAYQEVSKLQF